MQIDKRLSSLRNWMESQNIDAVIIPSADPHQSEYVASFWQGRKWISGFTGSAGTVAITASHAGVWTDSRYFLQAETELSNSEFVLHKMVNQFAAEYVDYLVEILPAGSRVAVQGDVWPKASVESMIETFKKCNIDLIYNVDFFAEIWQERPALSDSKILVLDDIYAGISVSKKLKIVRDKMAIYKTDHHLISALDDIAWTFNIRGNDVTYNPVVVAYGIVSQSKAHLFINQVKLSSEHMTYFAQNEIDVHPYEDIFNFLQSIPKSEKILVDSSICNMLLYQSINGEIVEGQSIPKYLKAIKNEVEINHFRKVMHKDGGAIANTFYWLDQNMDGSTISEYDLAQKLASFRSKQDLYFGESFGAIIGYESNGAIIHYDPPATGSAIIKRKGILLVDNGGQFFDGTTDITRTLAMSEPTEEQKLHYTLILKGMIALSKIKFPVGTTGVQLDTLARQFLWEHGLNYGHGTGHGVGFFLNVHEPPQGFANLNSERGRTIIEPGMVSSNEPGFYKVGAYGMRIENLILCIKSDVEGFLEFETLTLYPFEISLIEQKMLTPSEIKWINEYHQNVYKKVEPFVEPNAKEWFAKRCAILEWK